MKHADGNMIKIRFLSPKGDDVLKKTREPLFTFPFIHSSIYKFHVNPFIDVLLPLLSEGPKIALAFNFFKSFWEGLGAS